MRQIVTSATRGRRLLLAMIACALAVTVAACGGSSSTGTGAGSEHGSTRAKTLLKQTLAGTQAITSGTMQLNLVLTPTGSSVLKDPITLAVSGPFQSVGKGKVPDSDYTITGVVEGQTLRLRVISAGGHGYIEADGNDYELPRADYTRLESGFTSIPGTSAASRRKGTLAKLGIDPSSWIDDATVAGTETVDGTPTTRIDANVDVSALTSAFSKILAHASTLGLDSDGKLPSKLTPTQLAAVSSFLGTPRLSVWSTTADHSLRKLRLTDTIPVSGEISSALGGLTKVGVSFSYSYGEVNQRQTITAPPASRLKPYRQFQTKVRDLLETLEYVAIESASGASSSSSSSSSADSRYSRCVTKAGNNVTKLEKCQSLLK